MPKVVFVLPGQPTKEVDLSELKTEEDIRKLYAKGSEVLAEKKREKGKEG